MKRERFLVTGANGCIGAWVLNELQGQGATCFALDIAKEPYRPGLLMNEEQLRDVHFIESDITDGPSIGKTFEKHEITHVIHLAGLQVPFCKADPAKGAQVNVVGTVNLFEAIRHSQEQIKGFSYASSIAVLGPSTNYSKGPISDQARPDPGTLYGVYKQANEGTAKVYWNDYGIGSIGLRPYIVYGVARDQGLTSDLAKAILAAVAGRSFTIKFGGQTALQYARDVAQMFIRTARVEYQGHTVCNMQNDSVTVEKFIEILEEKFPNCDIDLNQSIDLPFPSQLQDIGLQKIIGEIPHTPLPDGIVESGQIFKELLNKGKIDLKQLEI